MDLNAAFHQPRACWHAATRSCRQRRVAACVPARAARPEPGWRALMILARCIEEVKNHRYAAHRRVCRVRIRFRLGEVCVHAIVADWPISRHRSTSVGLQARRCDWYQPPAADLEWLTQRLRNRQAGVDGVWIPRLCATHALRMPVARHVHLTTACEVFPAAFSRLCACSRGGRARFRESTRGLQDAHARAIRGSSTSGRLSPGLMRLFRYPRDKGIG